MAKLIISVSDDIGIQELKMTEQVCIENQPTGSVQNFIIRAKLRISTKSRLQNIIINDDAACNTPPPRLL